MEGKTVRHYPKGLGLIELMIGLAIVGIITSFAVPTYQQHILWSRRDSAIQQLLQLHLAQQHYRLSHDRFASHKQLQLSNSSYYQYSVLSASAEGFQLQAKALGDQKKDHECLFLRINQSMQRTPLSCWQ